MREFVREEAEAVRACAGRNSLMSKLLFTEGLKRQSRSNRVWKGGVDGRNGRIPGGVGEER